MPRPKKTVPDKSMPVRFPLSVLQEIKEVARQMGETEQEIIRICTRIGLEQLRRINYDIAKAIVDAAERPAPYVVEDRDVPMAAEEPGEYQAGRKNAK